jgi:hypothetical protein
MLLFLSMCKVVLEVGWLALAGQGALYLIAGRGRENNVVYQMFRTVTRPLMWVARRLTPPVVADAHLGLVAFLLVSIAWVLATAGIVHLAKPQISYADAVGLISLLIVAKVAGAFAALKSLFGLS